MIILLYWCMICVLGLVWDLGEMDLICCLIKLSVILLIKSVRIKEMMGNLTGIDYYFFYQSCG
jgi:hypothetical protein